MSCDMAAILPGRWSFAFLCPSAPLSLCPFSVDLTDIRQRHALRGEYFAQAWGEYGLQFGESSGGLQELLIQRAADCRRVHGG